PSACRRAAPPVPARRSSDQGATGTAVPGYRACVLDDDGRPAPVGTIGRLAVKGPTGCRYLDDPRQAQYVQDGWNLTGDAYLVDADRKSTRLNSSHVRISYGG